MIRKTRGVLSFLFSTLMAFQLVPAVALTQGIVAPPEAAERVPIESLLAAGDYAEGEAIAIVRGSADPLEMGEQLATVGSDAVEQAVADAAAADYTAADEIGDRVTVAEDKTFRIEVVRDPSRSTEQILRDLYADPRVVAAEPNYTVSASDLEGADTWRGNVYTIGNPSASSDGSAAGSAQVPLAAAENPADLTPYLWYADDSLSTAATPLSPQTGYSLNIPGWVEGRTHANAPANASGTVCIMDTGLDDTHPDLRGVLYEFTPEQQAKYNCGKYGVNASGDTMPRTCTTASGAHGTHVAGIVAAQWNGFGTSGIANGVKIFAVRIFGGNGSVQTEDGVLSGFQFLVDVAKETNLKAVNCSWGTLQPAFAYTAMVEELGKLGVNTVVASGNRNVDLDETIEVGGMVNNSPYAVTVDCAMANGKRSDFTCWGQTSTDVFSPGTSVISTMPVAVTLENNGKLDSNALFTSFYPEATAAENMVSIGGMERFGSAQPRVLFYNENPALNAVARPIGAVSSEAGFDDSRSMAFELSSLSKEQQSIDCGFSAVNGYFYMAIPVTSGADAKWISAELAMSDAFKPAGSIAALTCINADGEVVEVDSAYASALKKGWPTAASNSIYWCQWSNLSYNVDAYIEAANEAHEIYAAGGTVGEQTEAGMPHYPDPGVVTGAFGWQHHGQEYVVVKMSLGADDGTGKLSSTTKVYVDDVAVGGAGAYAAPYEQMSGTSMATPAVSGCLAVIAKDEPANSALSGDELELLARERAAKLLASVDYDSDLKTLCRTGGRVNLHGQTAFTKKAPLITRAEANGDLLVVQGCFFGDMAGTLEVDDVKIAPTSWADGRITATLEGLNNNSHVVKVVNGDGARMQALFSYRSESAAGRPLYECTLSVPVHLGAYKADNNDRFFGSMAACDGSIYAITAKMQYLNTQAMWRYDIAGDSWSRCADLPKSYRGQQIEPGTLAVLDGELYLYGGSPGISTSLWRYDRAADSWLEVCKNAPESSSLAVLDGQLFFVGGSLVEPVEDEDEGADASSLAAAGGQQFSTEGGSAVPAGGEDAQDPGAEDADTQSAAADCFFKFNAETGEVERVGGSMPFTIESIGAKVAASGGKIYYFGEEELYDDIGNIVGNRKHLLRFTYDAASNKMTSEDITAALESANPLYGEVVGQDIGAHFALAGLPDGVAIVGSDTLGEDTHIILDSATEATPYARTSSYHRTFDPLAVYANGYLYAMGNNSTEPDVMYFRATNYDAPGPAPAPAPQVKQTPASTTPVAKSAASPTQLAKTADNAQQEAAVAAGVAAVAALCAAMAFVLSRKRRER